MFNIGSSSSKKETSTTPSLMNMWTIPQQQTANQVGNIVQAGLTQPVPVYPGNMSVPITPQEQAYMAYATGQDPRMEAYNKILMGQGTQIDPAATEALYKQVEQNAMQNWQKQILPGLREQFSGPGYYGTARGYAEANAGQDLASSLAMIRANLMYQDELQRRQLEEASLGRTMTTAPQMAQMMGSAANMDRYAREQQVQSDFARWLSGEAVQGVTPAQYNPFLQTAFQYLNYFPNQIAYTTKGNESSGGFNFGIKI